MMNIIVTRMFLLGSPKAEQASRVQLRVTFSLDLFMFVCTSVRFWHYRLRLGPASSPPQHDTEDLIASYSLTVPVEYEQWVSLFPKYLSFYIILSSQP